MMGVHVEDAIPRLQQKTALTMGYTDDCGWSYLLCCFVVKTCFLYVRCCLCAPYMSLVPAEIRRCQVLELQIAVYHHVDPRN